MLILLIDILQYIVSTFQTKLNIMEKYLMNFFVLIFIFCENEHIALHPFGLFLVYLSPAN